MSDDEARYEALLASVTPLAELLTEMNQQGTQAYAPIVEDLLRSRSRDIAEIERTLDGLLDFCAYDPALALYKRLCRHLWDLDQARAVSYVHAYRELWDSDDLGADVPNADGVPG